jgi:hypothetical protein
LQHFGQARCNKHENRFWRSLCHMA